MPTNNLNLLTPQFYDKLPPWSFLDQIPTSVEFKNLENKDSDNYK